MSPITKIFISALLCALWLHQLEVMGPLPTVAERDFRRWLTTLEGTEDQKQLRVEIEAKFSAETKSKLKLEGKGESFQWKIRRLAGLLNEVDFFSRDTLQAENDYIRVVFHDGDKQFKQTVALSALSETIAFRNFLRLAEAYAGEQKELEQRKLNEGNDDEQNAR